VGIPLAKCNNGNNKKKKQKTMQWNMALLSNHPPLHLLPHRWVSHWPSVTTAATKNIVGACYKWAGNVLDIQLMLYLRNISQKKSR
jgi:hypothetical protein